MVLRTVVMASVLVAASAASAAPVPDASLRAVADRVVRLELDGAPALEGRVLRFDEATVTIALATTNEVVTIPRAKLVRLFAAPSKAPVVEVVAPHARRIVGLQFSLLGTLAVDADYKRFRAFASTNLLLPMLTASGDTLWVAAAAGAGVSVPLGETGCWRFDLFGQVLPFHTTSFYTYLGFGLGAGFHYTSSSGFTLGVTFPIAGFATRLGSSPTGYDASFRYNDSIGYYYLAGAAGMPLLTMGYRFAM